MLPELLSFPRGFPIPFAVPSFYNWRVLCSMTSGACTYRSVCTSFLPAALISNREYQQQWHDILGALRAIYVNSQSRQHEPPGPT